MAFGQMFTPRDLDVISRVLVKAAHAEPDMWKRKDIIGVLTKLQQSMKSRRTRAETRQRKAQAGQRSVDTCVPSQTGTLNRPGEE